MTERLYSIKYAAKASGLKPHLIRSWEARYQAIHPQRSDCNRRLFSDDDVQRLQMLKSAIEMGHTISSVASLSQRELARLIGGEPEAASRRPDESGPIQGSLPGKVSMDGEQLVARTVEFILKLDTQGLENLLTRAAVKMPRHHFLQHLVMPVFAKIGQLWANGEIKIIHEHMASVTVRAILQDMLRSVAVSRVAPKIVIATPIGHWHEFGALASALAASESGWRAVYMGPSLPSEEIAYAVKTLAARALSLSVCYRGDAYKLSMEIAKLRHFVGESLPIFIGGLGAAGARQAIEEARVVAVNDLRAYRDRLEALQ